MKLFAKILFPAVLFCACMTSCEDGEMITYSADSQVYFYTNATKGVFYDNVYADYRDSLTVFFPRLGNGTTEFTAQIPVIIAGAPANYDRYAKVVVDPASTAVAGQHYTGFTQDVLIPKGSVRGEITMKVHRTPDLAANTVRLYLTLVDNDQFKTSLDSLQANPTKKVSLINHHVVISDELLETEFWIYGLYGDFSRTKCIRMSEVLDITFEFLYTDVIYDKNGQQIDLLYMAKVMQKWLNEQASGGNIIRDENGEPMSMGPAAQFADH